MCVCMCGDVGVGTRVHVFCNKECLPCGVIKVIQVCVIMDCTS